MNVILSSTFLFDSRTQYNPTFPFTPFFYPYRFLFSFFSFFLEYGNDPTSLSIPLLINTVCVELYTSQFGECLLSCLMLNNQVPNFLFFCFVKRRSLSLDYKMRPHLQLWERYCLGLSNLQTPTRVVCPSPRALDLLEWAVSIYQHNFRLGVLISKSSLIIILIVVRNYMNWLYIKLVVLIL